MFFSFLFLTCCRAEPWHFFSSGKTMIWFGFMTHPDSTFQFGFTFILKHYLFCKKTSTIVTVLPASSSFFVAYSPPLLYFLILWRCFYLLLNTSLLSPLRSLSSRLPLFPHFSSFAVLFLQLSILFRLSPILWNALASIDN